MTLDTRRGRGKGHPIDVDPEACLMDKRRDNIFNRDKTRLKGNVKGTKKCKK